MKYRHISAHKQRVVVLMLVINHFYTLAIFIICYTYMIKIWFGFSSFFLFVYHCVVLIFRSFVFFKLVNIFRIYTWHYNIANLVRERCTLCVYIRIKLYVFNQYPHIRFHDTTVVNSISH